MRQSLPLLSLLMAASTALFSQTYTVVHNFAEPVTDGTYPLGPIVQGHGGAIVGATTGVDERNNFHMSRTFRVWPDGAYYVLDQFYPYGLLGGLSLARDGMFYGTDSNSAQVFRMSPKGTLTTLYDLHNIPGSHDWFPTSAPIESLYGDFYGTSQDLGSSGIVYKLTKDGKFTVLHTFSSDGTDGMVPNDLIQGTDDYIYGTTFWGGTQGDGTVFRISSSGGFEVLANFDGMPGRNPISKLIQASDGNFYGECFYGGNTDPNGNMLGSLFRMTPSGKLTILHKFTQTDGANPWGGLVQASDGNLYGVTEYGGKNNAGVLFRLTLGGNVVTVHDFADGAGINPAGSLIQHTNGKLYGIAAYGGAKGNGVFFSLDAGLPPFVSYVPAWGRAGATVEILGQGFTSGSQVFFNGKRAAAPTVVNSTFLRVMVPSGATTGPITVTTANGKLTSNKVFIVHRN